MNFVADLHIHSRFSRATSTALTVPHLAAWAACKGIDVLGTGDFTHPQWRAELREQLVLDEESGLYRLKGEPEALEALAGGRLARPAATEHGGPRFCLQAEISSIYKRGGKVRKVHNLVFVPTLEDADRLSERLALIGNLHSDGRPILGLDSRDLLEILLECVPAGVLIPAHVWTPWFAIFGSKSGFDRPEDCFGDLTEHIFALETGLSSDPAMNRLLSQLDGYALISNSDAHSGANLGREANLFAGRPSYAGMFAALRATARREPQDGLDCRFLGTMEFYPEEGKYHLDGHRACGVVLEPAEARELGDICPVCGRPLTIGVLHRVLELADRPTPPALAREPEVLPLVPLAEVIGEILGVGASSRKVRERYGRALTELGPELDILCRLPEAEVRAWWEPLGEAVARMRAGEVIREAGFDGQYGTVRLFRPGELDTTGSGGGRRRLPGLETPKSAGAPKPAPKTDAAPLARAREKKTASAAISYSPEQLAALSAGTDAGNEGPVFVAAGPGAGKTRILVGRVERLLEGGTPPDEILALTFTRRAAGEMRERLATGQAPGARLPACDTLHGLAWRLIREEAEGALPVLLGEDAALRVFTAANAGLTRARARQLWDALALARERDETPAGEPAEAAARYAARKKAQGLLDYGDLIDWLSEHAPGLRGRWKHILVDEAQDLSPVQLAAVRGLLPGDGRGFFGIGDPDQAIYGFRGAAGQSAESLRGFWPGLRVLRLGQSYRASQKVLDTARALLADKGRCGPLTAARPLGAELRLFAAPDARAEARWVAQRTRALIGATSHSLLDAARPAPGGLDGSLAPGDIAVLVRLKAQIPPLQAALEAAGVPCVAPAAEEFWRDELCGRFLTAAEERWREAREQGTALAPPQELLAQDCLAGEDAPATAGEAEGLRLSEPWRRLCRLWAQCGSWGAFFERLAWLHEAELVGARAERVRILTLHASKGLEFQAVFLPGLENGLLPLRRDLLFGPSAEKPSEAALTEERRLLYVGLTRAARGIFASFAGARGLYGRKLALAPSPFLDHIRAFCRESTLTRHVRRSEEPLSLL
ncbi:MAG: UvrD-helicase domain-containing protein [Desulfovibrio sp.]|uniref:UvrD-helicase domain-containing protein n=1 Tax=Desulfovibrio sp. TaxID=885 RepID=UPI001A7DEF06|nr:UvrD-helicase domain-containing protein [Desulfovibrio sp.]MBD5416886.1 UvrD-helicase domain-containing protein [Desulfovibrio sp.]